MQFVQFVRISLNILAHPKGFVCACASKYVCMCANEKPACECACILVIMLALTNLMEMPTW